MRITFISNYLNHHQRYLADELSNMDFKFIATREIGIERQLLGYSSEKNCDYLILSYESKELEDKAKRRIDSSDIVISGSAPEKFLKDYKKTDGILFRYTERPLKNGIELRKFLPRLVKWHYQNRNKKKVYLLCASAFTTTDYKKFLLFKNHAYKWGYFPETKKYDINKLLDKKNKKMILWCGRFVDWKHPEDAIKLAIKLKENGFDFNLKMIGNGNLELELKKLVKEYKLEEYVEFLGAIPSKRVREYMEQAGIYIFTSDRKEGWGAVLNEAMNSGCAVVASHLIGAAPYLVKHKENGLIYKSKNIEMLYEYVKFLLENQNFQNMYGEKAYKTIIDEWNAEVAAERLWNLSRHILDGEEVPVLYQTGPCSSAEEITEDWIYKEVCV